MTEQIATLLGILSTIVGATWYLGRLLSSIEAAIKAHVATDDLQHLNIEKRLNRVETILEYGISSERSDLQS